MTPATFRKLALALDGVVESSHMGHADFRAGGRIFATLGAPDEGCGMVRLLPAQQQAMLAAAPEVFFPATGSWGRAGCTHVRLKPALTATVRSLLELAHANATGTTRKPDSKSKGKAMPASPTSKSAVNRGDHKLRPDTSKYNRALSPGDQAICDLLAVEIDRKLPEAENRIWHAHPVWFLDGNPVVGYSKLKDAIRLLFWSGGSFEEEGLASFGKFRSADIRYTAVEQVKLRDLRRWLGLARAIQWDYKNIVKRKGRLERLK
jgi:hypothetical protein